MNVRLRQFRQFFPPGWSWRIWVLLWALAGCSIAAWSSSLAYWMDESATVAGALLPLAERARFSAPGDILFQLLMSPWIGRTWETPWLARLPFVLAMFVACAATLAHVLIKNREHPLNTWLVPVLFLTLPPLLLKLPELRSYAFVSLGTAAAWLHVQRAGHFDSRAAAWSSFAAAMHPIGAGYAFLNWASAQVRPRQLGCPSPKNVRLLALSLLPAAGTTLWFVLQMRGITPVYYSGDWHARIPLTSFFADYWFALIGHEFLAWPALFALFLTLGSLPTPDRVKAILWLTGPGMMVWFLHLGPSPFLALRYLVPAILPFWAVVLAAPMRADLRPVSQGGRHFLMALVITGSLSALTGLTNWTLRWDPPVAAWPPALAPETTADAVLLDPLQILGAEVPNQIAWERLAHDPEAEPLPWIPTPRQQSALATYYPASLISHAFTRVSTPDDATGLPGKTAYLFVYGASIRWPMSLQMLAWWRRDTKACILHVRKALAEQPALRPGGTWITLPIRELGPLKTPDDWSRLADKVTEKLRQGPRELCR